jgi:hypothetical protein
MLTVFGPEGDILLITRDVIFGRNQAEKSLERCVVPFEGFQQLCGRNHAAPMAEERKVWISALRSIGFLRASGDQFSFQLDPRWGSSLSGNEIF